MMKTAGIIVIVALAVALAPEAQASGSIRCGGHIIEGGQRHGPGKYEVLKKCGEPTERIGSTWVYDQRSGRRVLKFDDTGRLATIDRRST